MLFKPTQGSPELTMVICDELWVVKGRMSTFSDIREIILLKDYFVHTTRETQDRGIRKSGRHWYDQTVMTRTNLVDITLS